MELHGRVSAEMMLQNELISRKSLANAWTHKNSILSGDYWMPLLLLTSNMFSCKFTFLRSMQVYGWHCFVLKKLIEKLKMEAIFDTWHPSWKDLPWKSLSNPVDRFQVRSFYNLHSIYLKIEKCNSFRFYLHLFWENSCLLLQPFYFSSMLLETWDSSSTFTKKKIGVVMQHFFYIFREKCMSCYGYQVWWREQPMTLFSWCYQ